MYGGQFSLSTTGVSLFNAMDGGEHLIQDCEIWPQGTRKVPLSYGVERFDVLDRFVVTRECARQTEEEHADSLISSTSTNFMASQVSNKTSEPQ